MPVTGQLQELMPQHTFLEHTCSWGMLLGSVCLSICQEKAKFGMQVITMPLKALAKSIFLILANRELES